MYNDNDINVQNLLYVNTVLCYEFILTTHILTQ